MKSGKTSPIIGTHAHTPDLINAIPHKDKVKLRLFIKKRFLDVLDKNISFIRVCEKIINSVEIIRTG
ncbi:hypothetical protein [Paraburkholderia aspalathi]|uniref:hypothetical protein n=1 Tax=Paraburkholderia aspalathi TaxID=1324617 RepID=UPI00190D7708|nr:hypothetical protein [Paraburkholderia aspalathi]MBK3819571.1 hypothetical protein [Paraburkholderia aspalathi]MBK3831366.1 hypothetical protein [Paraburkholderia aspalathi]MBK3861128.1 hypothetical protein [Paraburkholderia aspalathi]